MSRNCGIITYSKDIVYSYDFDVNNTNSRMASVLFAQGFDEYELETYIENRFEELTYGD